MTIFMSEESMPTTATRPAKFAWPARRALPAGCSQQDRYPTRGHGTEQEPDTVILEDAEDEAAGRSLTEECTDVGDLDDAGHRMPEPSTGFVVLCGVACIAIVAACALVANALAT